MLGNAHRILYICTSADRAKPPPWPRASRTPCIWDAPPLQLGPGQHKQTRRPQPVPPRRTRRRLLRPRRRCGTLWSAAVGPGGKPQRPPGPGPWPATPGPPR